MYAYEKETLGLYALEYTTQLIVREKAIEIAIIVDRVYSLMYHNHFYILVLRVRVKTAGLKVVLVTQFCVCIRGGFNLSCTFGKLPI